MHLKYTEILAIVVHECETWSQYLRIINDFVFWNPYFIALQDFNYSETWGSYKTTTNLENIIFLKKKIIERYVSKLFAYLFKVART